MGKSLPSKRGCFVLWPTVVILEFFPATFTLVGTTAVTNFCGNLGPFSSSKPNHSVSGCVRGESHSVGRPQNESTWWECKEELSP